MGAEAIRIFSTEINARPALPEGVRIIPLTQHADDRGCFTELLRKAWVTGFEPNQINYVRSQPLVLRGVHVHRYHSDFLVFVEGSAVVALRDLRRTSSTYLQGGLFMFSQSNLEGLFIPPGVAHGFYFPEGGAHLYAVDKYFDGSDEYGCMFNDPALELSWPHATPLLSERDQRLPSLADLLTEIDSWR